MLGLSVFIVVLFATSLCTQRFGPFPLLRGAFPIGLISTHTCSTRYLVGWCAQTSLFYSVLGGDISAFFSVSFRHACSLFVGVGVRSEVNFAKIDTAACSSSEEDSPLDKFGSTLAKSQSEVELLFGQDSIFLSELDALLSDTDVGDALPQADDEDLPDERSQSNSPSYSGSDGPPAAAFSTSDSPYASAWTSERDWFSDPTAPAGFTSTPGWSPYAGES